MPQHWTSSTDEAILKFVSMPPGHERDELYRTQIHYPFQKICHVYWGKTGRHYYPRLTQYQFTDLMIPLLYFQLIEFKDRRKSISLHTYFYVTIHHAMLNDIFGKMKTSQPYLSRCSSLDEILNSQHAKDEESRRFHLIPFQPNDNPDEKIDSEIIIDRICQSISADITANNQEIQFGKSIIEYLHSDDVKNDGVDWRELRYHLKKSFPHMSKQYRSNLLRHFTNLMKRSRSQLLN